MGNPAIISINVTFPKPNRGQRRPAGKLRLQRELEWAPIYFGSLEIYEIAKPIYAAYWAPAGRGCPPWEPRQRFNEAKFMEGMEDTLRLLGIDFEIIRSAGYCEVAWHRRDWIWIGPY